MAGNEDLDKEFQRVRPFARRAAAPAPRWNGGQALGRPAAERRPGALPPFSQEKETREKMDSIFADAYAPAARPRLRDACEA
jgi:hypothetical protein